MEKDKTFLGPEDYAEPKCLLGGETYGKTPGVKPVPQQRIVEKVDEYMSRRDYAGVERHLNFWLEEARLGCDLRGELTIRNELIGHYRKVGEKEKAFENIERALALVELLGFEGGRSAATTYVNAGTACNAFGENERAVGLFKKAVEIFEREPAKDLQLLGGMYNNMALAFAALGRYAEAYPLYDRAIGIVRQAPCGCLEHAITLLNIAEAKEHELGMEAAEEQIGELLRDAFTLLCDNEVPRDGYYAFVCEKCAPTFSYYGYFADAAELNRRAKEIYER